MTAEWDELGRETRYEYHPGLHLVSRRINPDGSELSIATTMPSSS
ncbi:hypothetical protein ACEUD0_09625 [Aeromonas veronii]